MPFKILFSSLLLSSLLLGCSKSDDKESGNSGQAKVALDDAAINPFSADLNLMTNTCPGGNTCATLAQIAKFEIKLMSVGIHTQADTTQGYGSAIYANPVCDSPRLQTEVGGKMYSYVGFGTCSDASITTYLDLKSSTVTADLNSQYLPIAPGEYRYGAVTFCMGGAASNNYQITFSNDSGLPSGLRGQTVSMAIGNCGLTTPEMSPALSVAEGQAVVVTLQYDLTNTVYYRVLDGSAAVGADCAEVNDNGTRYGICVNPPTISASFSAP